MSFESDIERFISEAESRLKRTFAGVAGAMHESIVDGRPETTAPGQPVKSGNLRTSWQLRFPENMVAVTSTHVDYAVPIEELDTPLVSKVGGHHSVKLTYVNYLKLVAKVVADL